MRNPAPSAAHPSATAAVSVGVDSIDKPSAGRLTATPRPPAGSDVTGLSVGDRVCMEPGVPDPTSKEARLGMYNLDRELRFWATPPYAESLRAGESAPRSGARRVLRRHAVSGS